MIVASRLLVTFDDIRISTARASLQGTSCLYWSLSTRDKLSLLEPLYKGQVGFVGASLQVLVGALPLYNGCPEPLYKGQALLSSP